jgi:hypothetical protein
VHSQKTVIDTVKDDTMKVARCTEVVKVFEETDIPSKSGEEGIGSMNTMMVGLGGGGLQRACGISTHPQFTPTLILTHRQSW